MMMMTMMMMVVAVMMMIASPKAVPPFNCPPGGQMNEQHIHQQLIQWPGKWM